MNDNSHLTRRRPQQRRAEETKEKVLSASVEVLRHKGIDGLSIREVARTAGVSVGTIYEYFPSRHALLFWVAEQRLKERLDVFDGVFSEENFDRPLDSLISEYLDAMKNSDMYSRLDLEIRAAEERDQQLGEYTARYRQQLTDRYIRTWKRYGATAKPAQMRLIASYMHEIDHASMKLQLQNKPAEQQRVRDITAQLIGLLTNLAFDS
ncbi:MAG: TetR/AcrR family transcriptional regulator [Gammaproteobacteria bacterium]|nr:TetR/AcrR family transcriptional regulator [Gammaproteobacteria bacterium]